MCTRREINKSSSRHSVWEVTTSAAAISLALCLAAAGSALAAKPGGGGGGGHPGGGGAPHFGGGGGGGPHFGGGGGGAPHFGGGGGPHFSARAAAPHFTARTAAPHFTAHGGPHFGAAHAHFAPHVAGHPTHFARPSFQAHGRATARFAHLNHGNVNHVLVNHANVNHANLNQLHGNQSQLTSSVHPLTTTTHPLVNAHNLPPAHQAAFRADPKNFAEHRRRFADNEAFRPFWHHGWHPWHHLGWIGPLFWPFAYGDVFYYALWPDYYYDVDPFWAYGYGDIYAAVFSPYDYADYVQGPRAIVHMTRLTQAVAQSCSDEAAEVTGWPIDQIQAAVQPDQQQTALLDDLANALVKASDEVKANCPTTVSFTPTGRLAEMQQRLEALVDAVNIVSPPLDKFYDSLSDEQKARFNDIAPPASKVPRGQQAAFNPQAQCSAGSMAWPTDQIDRVVRPDDAQRAKLDALQSAAAQAANIIKAACPGEPPATPPARLAAVGRRLNAMLQGVQTIQPALAGFYNSLSDDQKARFNGMGRQLFASNER
jgi:hypothetical protein